MTKILFISSSWPNGPSFGGQLRALHVGRALKQIGDVTVLVVSSEADDVHSRASTAAEFNIAAPVLPSLTLNRGLYCKLRRAFDTRYLDLHGFAANEFDIQRVQSLISDFGLTWILNSRTPSILQRWHWPRTHLDIDDVPSSYSRTVSERAPAPMKRLKAHVQQALLWRREMLLKNRFTTLSVCSEADKTYLKGDSRVHVIPNGFQRPTNPPARMEAQDEPKIGFIGLFSYAPNLDGMQWFRKECWPAIKVAIPGIRLRLIGKDPTGALHPLEPDVDSLGWVADPSAEIATWSAMIVPIRFGGGTRIKIAEAFSRKCPVVSTSIGAFGYEVEHGKQLLLADRPADFSAACIQLVRNSDARIEIAERAWHDYLNKWTWEAIAPKVWAAAEDCLRRAV